jgi:NADH-quinone oxidoreductase subunit M
MENSQQLTALLIWPMLGSILAWFIPKASQRIYSLFISIVQFALVIYVAYPVITQTGQGLEQTLPWLSDLGIQLSLKLDSTSVWFVLLSGFVSFVVLGMKGQWYRRNTRLFSSMAFFLIFSINAAFLSSNLIVFYLSYEAVFIPMILMVGIWGSNTKANSVFRFFLMSFFGSILMLVSIFYLSYLYFLKTGIFSANLNDLLKLSNENSPAMLWCFAGFFLAFAIKVPLFPFHGWLKEVYVNAPAPATIWMSAILSKLGVYGFIRFVGPLFPEANLSTQGILLALAAFSVIYAAFLAIQAKDPKALLSYSSISHLGFVMLGVFSMGASAKTSAIVLSVSHGLTSLVLFYLYDLIVKRKEDVSLEAYSGLAKKFPILFVCLFIGVLASVSLPGTFNFVGEFLVLIHAYPVSALCTILAGIGVIFGAVYMLKFYQKLGFGVSSDAQVAEVAEDLSGFDLIVIVLILALIIYFGFHPSLFLGGMTNV